MNPTTGTTPALTLSANGHRSRAAHSMHAVATRVRAFEQNLLEFFKQGLIFGTVHTCIGQEYCAAALHPHLKPGLDAFFATHRGHGHYLAHGGREDALIAELMGREGALCLGRGGTQNLHFARFFSAGIQGGSAPIATGFALAMQRRGEHGVAVAQIGDGTCGEGMLYEAMNFAGFLQVPVLFLVEVNGWAQSTDTSTTTPGDLRQRAAGFGLETHWINDLDPVALSSHLAQVVEYVRQGNPFFQVIETRRLMAHSKGDDHRSPELMARLWDEDPLTRALAADADLEELAAAAAAECRALATEVAGRPLLSASGDQEMPIVGGMSSQQLMAELQPTPTAGRVAEELNAGLHQILGDCPNAVLIGEDLLDPYGGAFKVAKGLSTRFPDQVLSTPIAEGAIAGVSNGMALAGMRPIAEIMFADFATLAADQLINFSAKFHYMYGQSVRCPLTLRLVSGGGRGYGPTHSQSLERIFCGVPGLRVVALSQRHAPASLLKRVVLDDDGPTVFVESKLLYSLRPTSGPPLDLLPVQVDDESEAYPPLQYAPADDQAADVTVVTYGGSTPVVEAAMRQAIQSDELRFDYFVLTQLWPQSLDRVVASVRRTRRLVVVEENVAAFGVAAAVIAAVAQEVPGATFRGVGSKNIPIPAVRHLEDQVLPSEDSVASAIRGTLERSPG